MGLLIVRSNVDTTTDVLVPDLGLVIPSGGGSETFTDDSEIIEVQVSATTGSLNVLLTDGAFPGGGEASSDTLILNNGTMDIPPGDIPSTTAFFPFVGTDGISDGEQGLVPKPFTTDAGKFLKSDGTWAAVSATGVGTFVRPYTVGVVVRDVVYQKADGTVDRADASAVSTGIPVGIVEAIDVPAVGQATVRFTGDLTGFAGLTTGSIYILSTAPGGIVEETDTGNVNYPDTTPNSGNVLVEVGIAGSATTLLVRTLQDFEEL